MCATGGGTHTPCRTLTFPTQFSLRDVQTSRTRMAQGVCSALSHLTISPSPFSCFIRLLCCSLTVNSRPPSRLRRPRLPCRTSPDPKAWVKRTSARAAREFGYLADPTHSTFPLDVMRVSMSSGVGVPQLQTTLKGAKDTR